MPDVSVVILGGGDASRLPGKLERSWGGVPLLLRVYRNVCGIGPVVVSARGGFSAEIERELTCPVVIDRVPGQGPLGGLKTAFGAVQTPRIFVVAGDAPFVDARVYRALDARWSEGVDAVVAENSAGVLEPLCAIYARAAFLHAAGTLAPNAGVRRVLERLRIARVPIAGDRALASINTPADAKLLEQAAQ